MTTSTELFDDQKKRFSDFAQKDYALKVQYLTNHFQRMRTRFNYFVVIEAALIRGKTIFGDRTISIAGLSFGLALSLVRYVMGSEDRHQVRTYRDKDGTRLGRREEGSPGVDMLITREVARDEGVDLKLGRRLSMEKAIEFAKGPGAKLYQ